MRRLVLGKLIMGIVCLVLYFQEIAQGAEPATEKPLPPPLNIEFNMESTPVVGREVRLKLKVTPLEDIHAKISCLLPEGIEIIREKGMIIKPYRDKWYKASTPIVQGQEEKKAKYHQQVVMYVGQISAGMIKEFVLHVKLLCKGNYELIAQVDALAKWGIKDNSLIINIE